MSKSFFSQREDHTRTHVELKDLVDSAKFDYCHQLWTIPVKKEHSHVNGIVLEDRLASDFLASADADYVFLNEIYFHTTFSKSDVKVVKSVDGTCQWQIALPQNITLFSSGETALRIENDCKETMSWAICATLFYNTNKSASPIGLWCMQLCPLGDARHDDFQEYDRACLAQKAAFMKTLHSAEGVLP